MMIVALGKEQSRSVSSFISRSWRAAWGREKQNTNRRRASFTGALFKFRKTQYIFA